jgi:hypothetical protein
VGASGSRKHDRGPAPTTPAVAVRARRTCDDPGEDGEYVVYNLTPNMWEERWVRHVLSELPTSRYQIVDLWSPPPARPRARRLAIFLELLLPGPLRPTRRRLSRVIEPHDSSVFVYNTWGLDRAVREELSKLLARYERIGIVSVDEPTRDSKDAYERVAFAVRIGFHAPKYDGTQNLLVAPLGVPKNFAPPRSPRNVRERTFSWAFLGEIKNASRKNMVMHLERVRGQRFLHPTSAWESDDALRGTQYSDILANSIFAPSPPANVHQECYRTYEALECEAIPVVDTVYYRNAFEAPFPVVRPDWGDAPELLNRLLDEPESLERLYERCRGWWREAKRGYPAKIRALAARAH